MQNIRMIGDIERCPVCNKILFRKKGGGMKCLNECQQSFQRIAFNTLVEPAKDRRGSKEPNPWHHVKW